MTFKNTGILFFFLLCSWHLAAQKKFVIEKVSLKDLEMKVYQPDTSAEAVVLFDIGKLNGSRYYFTRKMRIKILANSGLDRGNFAFDTPSAYSDFDVVVYNIVDGKVSAEKASAKSIYTEKVFNDYYQSKVFAPNVKVGSIIDVTYSHLGPPFEWWFQDRIPVAYSELVLEPMASIPINKTYYGFENIKAISPIEWQAVAMPAFKMEPFLNDYRNYITKFKIYRVPNYSDFGWKTLNYYLMDYEKFGDIILHSAFLNDFARETNEKKLDTKAKISAAYEYIRSNIKWNGEKTIFASTSLRNNFLTTHNGSCADINLTLVALLKKLDLNAEAVILSTRDHGLLIKTEPNLNSMNYVVAVVEDGSTNVFLDATSEFLSPGILPWHCLNGSGLVVKRDTEQWLELYRGQADVVRHFVTTTITPEKVTAKLTQDLYGYAFLKWAEDVKVQSGDKELLKNKIQKSNRDIKVTDYEITLTESKEIHGQDALVIDLTDRLIDTGGDYLFDPFPLFEFASNPFKSDQRRFPVDWGSPREFTSTVLVQIQGFSAKPISESKKMSNADGSVTFTYHASGSGSSMQFRASLKVTKSVFTESEYLDLKQFFSEVAKKINSPIELSRT